VSFILPENLAGEVVGRIREINDFPFIRLTFPDYEEIGVGGTAVMDIYTTDSRDDGDGIQDMWEGSFSWAINGMSAILETRPDLTIFTAGHHNLPNHSPAAANLTFAQRTYLDFGDGSGYRFLTAIAQDFFAINNNNLRYFYQGLTDDSEYFLHVEFAVDAPENPAIGFNRAGTNEQYYDYGEKVAAFYDAFTPE
jgi:hypothetical protein